jgi:hypothetical protein
MKEILVKGKLWFFNLGTVVPTKSDHRRWEGCAEYNFVSGGQGERYKKAMEKLAPDDVICAYENGTGFRDIGTIKDFAKPVKDFKYNGTDTLHKLPLIKNNGDKGFHHPSLYWNDKDLLKCEYCCSVKWEELKKDPLFIQQKDPAYCVTRYMVTEISKPASLKKIREHFGIIFVDKNGKELPLI